MNQNKHGKAPYKSQKILSLWHYLHTTNRPLQHGKSLLFLPSTSVPPGLHIWRRRDTSAASLAYGYFPGGCRMVKSGQLLHAPYQITSKQRRVLDSAADPALTRRNGQLGCILTESCLSQSSPCHSTPYAASHGTIAAFCSKNTPRQQLAYCYRLPYNLARQPSQDCLQAGRSLPAAAATAFGDALALGLLLSHRRNDLLLAVHQREVTTLNYRQDGLPIC
ncbi:unnamed protein product [Zymoseptoria tritici ST99CH_3D1]|nr:unnamed protein product [Zymoseptoria tritici ST99CH_3D1]